MRASLDIAVRKQFSRVNGTEKCKFKKKHLCAERILKLLTGSDWPRWQLEFSLRSQLAHSLASYAGEG